jgi:hypothetical protein
MDPGFGAWCPIREAVPPTLEDWLPNIEPRLPASGGSPLAIGASLRVLLRICGKFQVSCGCKWVSLAGAAARVAGKQANLAEVCAGPGGRAPLGAGNRASKPRGQAPLEPCLDCHSGF